AVGLAGRFPEVGAQCAGQGRQYGPQQLGTPRQHPRQSLRSRVRHWGTSGSSTPNRVSIDARDGYGGGDGVTLADLSRLPMEANLSPAQFIELDRLQAALVELQTEMKADGRRLVVLFEGRDTAGKGGAILRFMRYLDPRWARSVALGKPSVREQGEWYFQRYASHLPTRGEIVLFDRSWYNRAVVEPGLGFCTTEQYERHLEQVPRFEKMLADDGIVLVKLWFSIRRETQSARLAERQADPRKSWKLSPVDRLAQERWDAFTQYKEAMYARTSTAWAPWVIARGDDRYTARTETMRYVLQRMGFEDPTLRIEPDPEVVQVYPPTGG
ncbi:MAG: polyphosphate kinase 2, partial [Myxococcota bacterium]